MTILHLFLALHDDQVLYPLYAEDEEQANQVTRDWIESSSPGRGRYTIMSCPGGYGVWGSHVFERFTLPGTLYLEHTREERH
ncbi:MAG TPA: hypothetical protein VKR06_28095, partial [Ktedonosporobacter sp.]|nr:hypothetical protein [Ktedonosporobacter sp.]